MNVPVIARAWERVNKTLELLPSLNTRTVIRHTLVKGWNMNNIEQYAKLDEKAEPWFIEAKGYVYVGYSRERLKMENMPSHNDVRAFSEKLAELTGYKIEDERKDSRVVLLGRGMERMIKNE